MQMGRKGLHVVPTPMDTHTPGVGACSKWPRGMAWRKPPVGGWSESALVPDAWWQLEQSNPGPGSWREAGASHQGKEDLLLHKSSCIGPLESVIRQVVTRSIYSMQWGLINFKLGGQRKLPCFTKEETEG